MEETKIDHFGKTCIINTLALSKLYYSASILKYPPSDVIKRINTAIYGFIWQKRDRIKRNTLIGKIEKGGIGIVDVETKFKALKAAWIPRIMFRKSSVYSFVSSFFMQQNIDCKFILKTNVTNFLEIRKLLHGIPQFYVEVLSAFNECKHIDGNLTCDQFLSQPIWNNKLFKYNEKTLCYKNWIKSGILYVRELFDDNGFKEIDMFRNILMYKANWICEYNILKRVFNRYCEIFDTTRSKYINIKENIYFLFHGNICEHISDKKCRFFYHILLERKFIKPHSERKWHADFNINFDVYGNKIYIQKIINIKDKEIAEFNYKLLHNLLNCNKQLSKWKVGQSNECPNCSELENIFHLLYSCDIVKHIWHVVQVCVSFDISWKIILCGFFHEVNKKTLTYNNLISFIAFKIYKYKMYSRVKNERETEYGLREYMKKHSYLYYCTLKNTNIDFDYKIFEKVSELI